MTDDPRDPSSPHQEPPQAVDWALAPTLTPDLGSAETLAAGSDPGTGAASSLEALPDAPVPGTRIDGRYVVLDELGHGGMGRVLRVRDERIRREVALKCLLDDGAGTGSNRDTSTATRLRRFQREVQLSGQLEHPSIVPIHDLGGDEDHPYYTMRYIQGKSLAEALREAATPAARLHLLPHFRDVCNAMAFAHDRRIVHRDLKPANVILGHYGETMVIDWGLAKVQGEGDESDRRLAEGLRQIREVDDSQTVFGAALGTPAYMAPEQALGQLDGIDHQSDIYSLGAMLYELLTGAPPFSGGHPHRVMLRVVEEPLTPVRQRAPGAPAELAAVAEKALHKDKRLRYASCAELAADVSAWLSGEKVSIYAYSSWELVRRFIRRNRLAVAAALVVLVALVGTAIFMTRAWRQEVTARARAQEARARELDARLEERRAREEEARQKEVAQGALVRKIEEERAASHHLAEAHLARAEHLFRERFHLEAGLHAAAAALHHPGNPGSPRFYPGFCAGRTACEGLTARALGIFLLARQSTHLSFERHLSLEPPLNVDLYTRNRLHPSPDGRHWIVVSNDPVLRVFDLFAGRVTHRLADHGATVCQAAFDAAGARLVSVDQNGEWIFRAFPEGKLEARVHSDLDTVFLLEPLPELGGPHGAGGLVAVLMDGRVVRVDPVARTFSPLWSGPVLPVQDLVISPDGRHLAVLDRRGGLRFYDRKTGGWRVFERKSGETHTSFGTFDPSGRAFVFPDAMRNRLTTYETGTFRITRDVIMQSAAGGDFHHSLVPFAARGPSDRLIAEQSNHFQLLGGPGLDVLQNFRHKAPLGSVRTIGGQVAVLGSKSDLTLLVPAPADRAAVVAVEDGIIGLIQPLDAHTTLAATWTGEMILLDHRTRGRRSVGRRADGYVWAADLSPDGTTLAMGSWDHTVALLDHPGGALRPGRTLKFESPVTFVRFSRDGRRLFVATFQMLHVLDTANYATLDRHIIGVVSGNGPPVSASATHIAFHETDDEISLLELGTLRLSAIKPDVKNLVEGATRMIEPGILVVQDDAFCLHLLNPPDRRPRHKLCGFESFLATASLNAAGTLLLASGDDHTVRLWSIPDGRQLLVLPTVVGQVAAFDFTQKNLLFERGNEVWRIPLDRTLWDLPATDLVKTAEAQAGLCLDGAQTRPLHECGAKAP